VSGRDQSSGEFVYEKLRYAYTAIYVAAGPSSCREIVRSILGKANMVASFHTVTFSASRHSSFRNRQDVQTLDFYSVL
jgi:hypothetical protein